MRPARIIVAATLAAAAIATGAYLALSTTTHHPAAHRQRRVRHLAVGFGWLHW